MNDTIFVREQHPSYYFLVEKWSSMYSAKR